MAIKLKRGTTESWALGPELVDFGRSSTKGKDSVIRAEGTELEMYVYTTSANEWWAASPSSGGQPTDKIPGLPIYVSGKRSPEDAADDRAVGCTLKIYFEAPSDCTLEYLDGEGDLCRPQFVNYEYIDTSYKQGAGNFPQLFVKWPAEKVGTAEPVPIKIRVSLRENWLCEELEEGQLGLEYTEDGHVRVKAGMPGVFKWNELPYIGGADITVDNALNPDSTNPISNKAVATAFNQAVEDVNTSFQELNQMVEEGKKVVIITQNPETGLYSHSGEEAREMITNGLFPVVIQSAKTWLPGDWCTTGGKSDQHFWHYDCDNKVLSWAELKPSKTFSVQDSIILDAWKSVTSSHGTLINELNNHMATIDNELIQIKANKGYVQIVSYEELTGLRDRNSLIPGAFYRITDYECYVSAEGAQALNDIDFDIIVQALSNSQLSEHAQAIFKTVADVTLSPDVIEEEGRLIEGAVEFIYQEYIDGGDYDGFGEHSKEDDVFIAYGYSENNEGIVVPVLYKTDRCGLPSAGEDYNEEFAEPDWTDEFYYIGRATIDGEEYDKWQKIDTDYNWETPQKFVYTNVVTSYEVYSPHNFSAWELKYCLDNDTSRFEWANENDGMGVIYYMKDEWGNEAPYDFKNIVLDINGIKSYTFSTSGDEDGAEDGFFQDCVVNTLKGDNGILKLPHCGVRAIERQSNVVFGKNCENVTVDIQVEGIPSIQIDPCLQDIHAVVLPEHNMTGKNLIVRAHNTQEILF